jgi:MFS family permease
MRAALGVIVSFTAMSVFVLALSLAPWFMLGLDTVLEPRRFETTALFNAYAIALGILGAVFAGWLCATIGRSRSAVLALAVLCFAGGLMNVVMQNRKPEPGPRPDALTVIEAVTLRKEPAWFTLLMPAVGTVSVLLSGRRALRP